MATQASQQHIAALRAERGLPNAGKVQSSSSAAASAPESYGLSLPTLKTNGGAAEVSGIKKAEVNSVGGSPSGTSASRQHIAALRAERGLPSIQNVAGQGTRADADRAYEMYDALQKQIKRLQDERDAKVSVYEDGIYMGENKAIAAEYDKKIKEVSSRAQAVKAGLPKAGWGKVIVNRARSGLTGADHAIAQTLNAVVGGFLNELHILGGTTLQSFIPDYDYDERSFLQRYVDEGEQRIQRQREAASEAANGNRAAQTVGDYTEMVANSAPMAIMAMVSAPLAAAGTGTTMSLQTAAQLAQSGKTLQSLRPIANATVKMMKDPNWLMPFIQTAGPSYADALNDGASAEDAAIYAVLNGAFNATTEVGGSDEMLGGLQKLAPELYAALKAGDDKLLISVIKSIPSEMGEELIQGIGESGLKSLYKDVPLYSDTDQGAIINPERMADEAKGAAVVSAVLGGGQAAVVSGHNALHGTSAKKAAAPSLTSETPAAETTADWRIEMAADMLESGATKEEIIGTTGLAPLDGGGFVDAATGDIIKTTTASPHPRQATLDEREDALKQRLSALMQRAEKYDTMTADEQAALNAEADAINAEFDAINTEREAAPTAALTGGIENARAEVRSERAGDQLTDERPATGDVSGVGERNDSPSPGEQVGAVPASAGQPRAVAGLSQIQRANQRENTTRHLRGQEVSSNALGISSGTDTRSNRIIPARLWDEELSDVADWVSQETGRQVIFVINPMERIGADGKPRTVRGAILQNKIIIQANHSSTGVARIAAHEIYHYKAETSPGLDYAVKQAIVETYGENQFNKVLDKYIDAFNGLIDLSEDPTGTEFEEAVAYIEQEIFADAYAGINAFGAHADEFGDTAVQITEARTSDTRQANGTRETRGPPARRYSINNTREMNIKDQLRMYRAGQMSTHDEFSYGATPSVLNSEGMNGEPLVMSQTDFIKSKSGKHNVPTRAVVRMTENLSKPILSFGDDKSTGILVDDIDGDGKPLLIGIAKGVDLDSERVNRIKSAYGLDTPEAWISNQLKAGKQLRIYDIEKAESFLDEFGYLAERPENFRFGDIVTEVHPKVKGLSLPTIEDYIVERDNVPEQGGLSQPTVESNSSERYSIDELHGENGDYGIGVILDTKLFDNVKPRNWGRVLSNFVYSNLAGAELEVYDESGRPEIITLARENDRVKKDGAKSSRKVLDKLARYNGNNIRALTTVQMSEALLASRYENTTDEHTHQWMDENGWEHRKVYLQDISGNIYQATLNIANGRDRRILYDINMVRQIDKNRTPGGAVPSTKMEGARSTSRSSADNVAQPEEEVKGLSLPTIEDYIAERDGPSKAPAERFSYGGRWANGADIEALRRAEELERQDVAAETVRQNTGWFRGMDGKWRFEIDDSGMKYRRSGDQQLLETEPEYARYQELEQKMLFGDITPEEQREAIELSRRWGSEKTLSNYDLEETGAELQDIISHDALFKAYPQLRHAPVYFADLPKGTLGLYDKSDNSIAIDKSLRDKPHDTIVHEIQHAIQEAEGFSKGSSPQNWNKRREDGYSKNFSGGPLDGSEMLPTDLYANTAGEIEARDAASRRTLTAEQRRTKAPALGDDNTVFADDEDGAYSADDQSGKPASEADALRREISRLSDKAYQQGVFDSGGIEALQKVDKKIKKYTARLEKLGQQEASAPVTPAERKTAAGKEQTKAPGRRGETKPVAKSDAIIAKKDLRQTLTGLFSTPEGSKAELGKAIDQIADRIIQTGELTERDRTELFDRLYATGEMLVTAAEYYADTYQTEARSMIEGRRIFVNDSVRGDFGEDWNAFRRRAFGAGIYLTSNPDDLGVDRVVQELGKTMPGQFDEQEYDMRTHLEHMLSLAEAGRDKHMSLDEYAEHMYKNEGIPMDYMLDTLESKMDYALRAFGEKAKLEIYLRDRTGRKIQQEREKAWENSKKQSERKSAQEKKERERRKEISHQAVERKNLSELQQRTLKTLQWLSRNRNKAPEELRAAWDEVLGDIDIYSVGAANAMNWSKKYQATWQDLAQMYKDARANDPNFMPSAELEKIVARIDDDKIADMDIGALQDLYKAAVALRTEFYNRNNVIDDEMHSMFSDVFSDSKADIERAPGKFTGKKTDSLFNLQQLTPMNVIQRMVGWKPDSAFYTMARQLEKGERDMRDYTVRAGRELEEFLTEHEDFIKKSDGQGKDAIWYEIKVPELLVFRMGDKPIFGETVKVYMTPAQKVQLYLESKNTDNLAHMLGGRTFVDRELYSQGKRQEALEQGTTVKLAPEVVKRIVSDMTDEELEMARVLEKYYNDFAKKRINRVSNALYGYDKAIAKNYTPIFTNKNYASQELGVYDTTAEGVPNMKGRIPYSKSPSYNLSAMDAFERHVDQTSRFVGMSIPARNWNRLLNWQSSGSSMRDIISQKWGGEAKTYIEDLIKELQGDAKPEKRDVLTEAAEKVRGNYISAIFGFNPSIVLKQLGSIPMGGTYLGAENLPSPAQVAKIDRELINKYTSELAYRTLGYSSPETKQLKDNPNWTQTNKVTRLLFGGGAITATDAWAASTLWPQAENKVRREHPELELGSQEDIDSGNSPFYKKVAEEFNTAVARSQSTADMTHQSSLRKSKNIIARTFTMFKSDSAQTYNAIRQKAGELQYYQQSKADAETISRAKKELGTAVTAAILNAMWSSSVGFAAAYLKNAAKYYRDDDDELTAESIAKQLVMDTISGLAGVTVGGEELAELIGSIFTGDKWYGIDTPGLGQLMDFAEAVRDGSLAGANHVKDMADILKNGGDIGEYLKRYGGDIVGEVKDFAQTVATYIPGLPVDNIEAYLLGTVRLISPAAATAYADLMKTADKSGLKGLEGMALETRVKSILKNRAGGASDETAAALAALYKAGYKEAVPTDTPGDFQANGNEIELDAYGQQVYDQTWRDIVGGSIDPLVSSAEFKKAGRDTQVAMLRELYDFASAMAKKEIAPSYNLDKQHINASELVDAGASPADWAVWEGKGVNVDADTYRKFDDIDAYLEAEEDISELEPLPGNDSVAYTQKWTVIAESGMPVEDQLKMIESNVYSDRDYCKIATSYNNFGVTPALFAAAKDEMYNVSAEKSGDNKISQDEAELALRGILQLNNEGRAAIWQLMNYSWKPTKNPFDPEVGERALALAKELENERAAETGSPTPVTGKVDLSKLKLPDKWPDSTSSVGNEDDDPYRLKLPTVR